MDTYTECLGPGNKCPINANFLLSFSQEKKCPKSRLATKMLISGMCPCVRINSINFVVKLGRKKECSGCLFCTLGPLPSPNLPFDSCVG